jgi:hypothetical protein
VERNLVAAMASNKSSSSDEVPKWKLFVGGVLIILSHWAHGAVHYLPGLGQLGRTDQSQITGRPDNPHAEYDQVSNSEGGGPPNPMDFEITVGGERLEVTMLRGSQVSEIDTDGAIAQFGPNGIPMGGPIYPASPAGDTGPGVVGDNDDNDNDSQAGDNQDDDDDEPPALGGDGADGM